MSSWWGIRSKITMIAAVPLAVLTVLGGVMIERSYREMREARAVSGAAEHLVAATDIVTALQAERLAHHVWLHSDLPESEKAKQDTARKQAMARVDRTVGDYNTLPAVDTSGLERDSAKALSAVDALGADLTATRQKINAGQMTTDQVNDKYAAFIEGFTNAASVMSDHAGDAALAAQLRSHAMAIRISEVVWDESEAIYTAGLTGRVNDAERAKALGSVERLSALQKSMTRYSSESGENNAFPALTQEWKQLRDKVLTSPPGENLTLDANAVDKAVKARTAAFAPLQKSTARTSAERAGQVAQTKQLVFFAVVGVAVATIISGVLVAWLFGRNLSRRIRSLTMAADHMREMMPELMAKAHTAGESIELEEIPVTSDELGRLAKAFNEVNATTIATARDQAKLRDSVATMFVNVARRDQVLLGRQLTFLGEMSSVETDPVVQESLSRLERLATRMRRNAESLLVMAGVETGRRPRQSMPLSEIASIAVSEIEDGHRVDVNCIDDPRIQGHHALSVAHVMAELLENGCRYSNPNSRVHLEVQGLGDGCIIRITDSGIGLSPDEVTDALITIEEAQLTNFMKTDKLGLAVVGRLARRLQATIGIESQSNVGSTVSIELPAELFDRNPVPASQSHGTTQPVQDAAISATLMAPLPGRAATMAPTPGQLATLDLPLADQYQPNAVAAQPLAPLDLAVGGSDGAGSSLPTRRRSAAHEPAGQRGASATATGAPAPSSPASAGTAATVSAPTAHGTPAGGTPTPAAPTPDAPTTAAPTLSANAPATQPEPANPLPRRTAARGGSAHPPAASAATESAPVASSGPPPPDPTPAPAPDKPEAARAESVASEPPSAEQNLTAPMKPKMPAPYRPVMVTPVEGGLPMRPKPEEVFANLPHPPVTDVTAQPHDAGGAASEPVATQSAMSQPESAPTGVQHQAHAQLAMPQPQSTPQPGVPRHLAPDPATSAPAQSVAPQPIAPPPAAPPIAPPVAASPDVALPPAGQRGFVPQTPPPHLEQQAPQLALPLRPVTQAAPISAESPAVAPVPPGPQLQMPVAPAATVPTPAPQPSSFAPSPARPAPVFDELPGQPGLVGDFAGQHPVGQEFMADAGAAMNILPGGGQPRKTRAITERTKKRPKAETAHSDAATPNTKPTQGSWWSRLFKSSDKAAQEQPTPQAQQLPQPPPTGDLPRTQRPTPTVPMASPGAAQGRLPAQRSGAAGVDLSGAGLRNTGLAEDVAAPRTAGRARSEIASAALAELSALSSYTPAEAGAGGSLQRRQRGAALPKDTLPPAPRSDSARRQRTPEEVRSMLSGFQSGVHRGRQSHSELSTSGAETAPGAPTPGTAS